jgi:hypothetical protein
VTPFITGGPPRFDHQRRGLQQMISTGGITALLFDPGLGKTATVLDYAGLLALKSRSGEARVLVICPLVAVDTWVLQAEIFTSPQVNVWAESLGGGLLQRAEALAARGGNAYRHPLVEPPKRKRAHHPRALHHELAWAWMARSEREVPVTPSEGPDGLGTDRPRIVLEVINLDTLQYRTAVGSQTMADVMVDAIKRYNPDLVVVDESHKIKSPQANASRLLGRVSKYVRRRVLLTGTVRPHSPLDVFAQWRFLEPYAFGERQIDGSRRQATFGGFKSRYAELGGWMGKEVISFKNLDEMQRIMARNAVVARKSEALDLPPTTDVVIPVDLAPAETRAYADMKGQLATQLANGAFSSSTNRLTQMLRLRQITSGHLPDDSGVMNVIGNSKVNTIRSLVQDTLAGEKRVVIFALFTIEIAMLAKALTEKGTEVMVIEGGTSMEDRAAMRRRFGDTLGNPGRIVMVAQIKTMSLAVNELVTASHAIFASLSQQRDDLEQAKARLDRTGQTRPVTFWFCLAPGTVDGVIYKSHQDRTSLEDAMLHHIQQGN